MKTPLCVVHLFHGEEERSVTAVKGYPVCKKHLSFNEDFFRKWELAQDPKQPDKGK